jgi:hypothetical protein
VGAPNSEGRARWTTPGRLIHLSQIHPVRCEAPVRLPMPLVFVSHARDHRIDETLHADVGRPRATAGSP